MLQGGFLLTAGGFEALSSAWARAARIRRSRGVAMSAEEGADVVTLEGVAGNDRGGGQQSELQAELARLKEEHRDLDRAIEALEDSVASDRLQLQRLKKRKLQLRDRIQFVEDQILPDIIA